MPSMTRILLTGVGSPASQNVLSCLRMAPEPLHIVGCDVNPYHLEWGELDGRYLAPLTSDPGYLDWLNALIDREQIDFVHGQPDGEVAFLAAHAGDLHAKTFLPRPNVIAVAQDKFTSARIWQEFGLRADWARPLRNAADLPREWRDYPLWLRATRGAGAKGSCKVMSYQHADHWLKCWAYTQDDSRFMLQEVLPGTEFAWHSLWWDGELVCSAAREYVEKPTSQHLGQAGVSSSYIVARSTHRQDVNEVGEAAVRALDPHPHGTYGMDLRCDAQNVVRPTECNAGRFKTTSLFLAMGGCNMPYWFVAIGMGSHERSLLRYNALPEGLLWICHMDCQTVLVHQDELRAAMLEALGETERQGGRSGGTDMP